MKRSFIAAAAATIAITAASAGAVSAGAPSGAGAGNGVPAGIACQQAGISTLRSLGLLSAVARDGIEVVGVGTVPFRTVLALHRSDPALFQTGGVSVVVPGVGAVPAAWCDGA